ncbi:MAG: M48 family metallopeptidase [Myxococcales bacterium]|nr:M48 family metallopeptidase [Myxococcales bacterium]
MTLRLSALHYDGQTSRAQVVEVEMDPSGAVRVSGDGVDLSYAKDDVRIAARMGNTPRSITFVDGQKCETRDNDTADAMEARLGMNRVGRAVFRLESRMRTALAALAMLVGLVAAGIVWGVPFVARVVAERVPPEVAASVGAGTLRTLDRTVFEPSTTPPETQERLREAFASMADRYPELPLHLEFRQLGLPNAFALPDGTVVVTDELVELADHDGEIMAVLAHEIGHVHHRHGLRMALESSSVALLVSVYLGDVAQVSSVLAALPSVYAQAAYSRSHETEADSFALAFMQRTGQDPHDFAAIMTKLQAAIGGDDRDGAWQYLASHPPTKERIARFAAAAHP